MEHFSPDDFVAALNKRSEVSIEHNKPLRLYLRSADQLFKQACVYKREGDLERAYVLFLKFSNLIIKEIPKHPDYIQNDAQVKALRASCVMALDICEAAKPVLINQYAERLEASQKLAQKLRDQTEAQARLAHERAAEQERFEASRQARMKEIQMMEAQRTYELQKQKEIAQQTETVDSSYLDLLPQYAAVPPPVPVAPVATLPSPPAYPPSEISAPSPGPKYYSESGAVLRSLHVPPSIIGAFLDIAAKNTKRGIETCGVLAGVLSQNKFALTHLIIPKQEGTSDTCHMVAEEEVLEVQDKLDLLTLGWIHTHPTQQCFLSSVDLHTHFPYQLMMAEAIAIVVAPTQSPNFGIFRLTDPPGLDVIASCPERGFHAHNTHQPIYRSLNGQDSHAQLDPSLSLQIVDLR